MTSIQQLLRISRLETWNDPLSQILSVYVDVELFRGLISDATDLNTRNKK